MLIWKLCYFYIQSCIVFDTSVTLQMSECHCIRNQMSKQLLCILRKESTCLEKCSLFWEKLVCDSLYWMITLFISHGIYILNHYTKNHEHLSVYNAIFINAGLYRLEINTLWCVKFTRLKTNAVMYSWNAHIGSKI